MKHIRRLLLMLICAVVGHRLPFAHAVDPIDLSIRVWCDRCGRVIVQ